MADLVEQLRQLSELHQSGSLSDAEFNAAKDQLLNSARQSVGVSPSLLALQNELAALDRQWTLEREKYKVAGRYSSSIPNEGDGAKAGTIIAIFGGIWTLGSIAMATAATRDGVPALMALGIWLFPIFGVFFVISGLSKGAEMTSKASQYQQAEAKYQRERAELEARIRALS